MAKRRRATALVIRHGRVLLVRHRGETHYSLPGGGIDKGETSLEAAIREVREETQLRAYSATRRRECDVVGSMSRHLVSEVKVGNEQVKLQGREIAEHKWWDGKAKIRANGHVHAITKSAKLFPRSTKSSAKRNRATALVVEDGKVLVVRRKGATHYSLPSGDAKTGESTLETAVRVLREETGIRPKNANRRFQYDHEGRRTKYLVVGVGLLGSTNEVKLDGKVNSNHRWWDGSDGIQVENHVEQITRASKVFYVLQGGGYPAP